MNSQKTDGAILPIREFSAGDVVSSDTYDHGRVVKYDKSTVGFAGVVVDVARNLGKRGYIRVQLLDPAGRPHPKQYRLIPPGELVMFHAE